MSMMALWLSIYSIGFVPGHPWVDFQPRCRKDFSHDVTLVACLFCCFTSQATAKVMAGRSVQLTTFFLGKLEQAVNQYFVHILSFVTDNNPS